MMADYTIQYGREFRERFSEAFLLENGQGLLERIPGAKRAFISVPPLVVSKKVRLL